MFCRGQSAKWVWGEDGRRSVRSLECQAKNLDFFFFKQAMGSRSVTSSEQCFRKSHLAVVCRKQRQEECLEGHYNRGRKQ